MKITRQDILNWNCTFLFKPKQGHTSIRIDTLENWDGANDLVNDSFTCQTDSPEVIEEIKKYVCPLRAKEYLEYCVQTDQVTRLSILAVNKFDIRIDMSKRYKEYFTVGSIFEESSYEYLTRDDLEFDELISMQDYLMDEYGVLYDTPKYDEKVTYPIPEKDHDIEDRIKNRNPNPDLIFGDLDLTDTINKINKTNRAKISKEELFDDHLYKFMRMYENTMNNAVNEANK
jgi:hypothetical protein